MVSKTFKKIICLMSVLSLPYFVIVYNRCSNISKIVFGEMITTNNILEDRLNSDWASLLNTSRCLRWMLNEVYIDSKIYLMKTDVHFYSIVLTIESTVTLRVTHKKYYTNLLIFFHIQRTVLLFHLFDKFVICFVWINAIILFSLFNNNKCT